MGFVKDLITVLALCAAVLTGFSHGISSSFAGEKWRSEYDSISEYSDDPYHVGRVYRVNVEDLRPTQFGIGIREVKIRLKKIEKMDREELRQYLKEKVGSVIVGPGEEFWLVDGHHLARALELDDDKEMLVRLLHDWSNLSEDEFYAKMTETKKMWLYDENGRVPHDPRELPKKLSGLKNDPYRSLVYIIKKHGGFRDTKLPFQEFIWANFFRTRIERSKVLRPSLSTLKLALRLAHSPMAKNLPGYLPKAPRNCEELLLN